MRGATRPFNMLRSPGVRDAADIEHFETVAHRPSRGRDGGATRDYVAVGYRIQIIS